MTDARARLEAERRETVVRLTRLRADFGGIVEASRDSNADDEHDPEGGVDLERLRLGSYGFCERCGRRVPDDRLEVRPVARTCVGCT